MITAFNLATGVEISFDDATTPEYAVAYGHYVESLNMASWFFQSIHDAVEQKRSTPLWMEKSNFIYGRYAVNLGDWTCKLSDL